MIKDLNNVLQNKNMKYIVILVALCYIFTLQYIDRDLLEVINSLAFRVVYSIVVIYISQVSPSISIILFMLFMFTLHELNCKKHIEGFLGLKGLFTRSVDTLKPDIKDVKYVKDVKNVNDVKDVKDIKDIKDIKKDIKDVKKDIKHPKDVIKDPLNKPRNIVIDGKDMFRPIVPGDDTCKIVKDPKTIDDVKGYCPEIEY